MNGNVRTAIIRLIPAIAWMGIIFAMSSQSTIPQTPSLPADLIAIAGHLVAFGVLAALLYLGLASWLPGTGLRAAVAFVMTVLYGVSDEFHQSFVPGRDASLFDVVVDGIGAAVALAIILVLIRLRQQDRARA